MPDETIKNDSTEVTESEAIEPEAEEASAEGEESENSSSTETDYKVLYEAEAERAEKARKAAAREAFKAREAKREESEDVIEDEEDKPLTKKDLQTLLLRERQETKKQLEAARIREVVATLADSDDEARYIVEIHKNRVWPEDVSLEEQLEEAHAIANRKRLIAKNAELGRALKGREGALKTAPLTQRDGLQSTAPKIGLEMNASLKRAGFCLRHKG
jgi:hypothetical protein